MAVYINFVCDHQSQTTNKRCLLQQVNFDTLIETWGNMVDAMKEAGWDLEMEGARIVKCICPDHKSS